MEPSEQLKLHEAVARGLLFAGKDTTTIQVNHGWKDFPDRRCGTSWFPRALQGYYASVIGKAVRTQLVVCSLPPMCFSDLGKSVEPAGADVQIGDKSSLGGD